MPTEAEWEYACRAGATSDYDHLALGGGNFLPSAGSFFGFTGSRPEHLSQAGTTAVGSYTCNGFGLYDMRGNVWEWCSDWYDPEYYRTSPSTDPQGPKDFFGVTRNGVRIKERLIRGGAYNSVLELCRPAFRGHKAVDSTDDPPTGFRVVCVVPEAEGPTPPGTADRGEAPEGVASTPARRSLCSIQRRRTPAPARAMRMCAGFWIRLKRPRIWRSPCGPGGMPAG